MQGKKRVRRWRYTNEFGRRVEGSWHMSESDAAHYKDAEKIEGTLFPRALYWPSFGDFDGERMTSASPGSG